MDTNLKILIVDDEKPLANVLSTKLKIAGFNPTAAYNGEEAINYLKTEHFDLVLLDLIMPNLNGFDVLEFAKTQQINTPIIVTTNLNQPEDLQKAQQAGAKAYLVKSNTSLSEIVDYVKKYVTQT